MQGQVLDAPRELVGHALAVRLGVIPELQVLGAPVFPIPVDVVNRLGVAERSPK